MTSAQMACAERLATSREKLRQALNSTDTPKGVVALASVEAATLALLEPYAQKNPLSLVAVAFLAGGILAWSRPQSTSLASVLVKELLPRITPVVAAAIAQRRE